MYLETVIPGVAFVASVIGIFKFLFDLKKEMTTMNDKINDLNIEVIKLQNRFDIIDNRHSMLGAQFNEFKTEFKTETKQDLGTYKESNDRRLTQIETEAKNILKDITHKLAEIINRQSVL